MLRTYKLLLVGLLTSLLANACGKDDDDDGNAQCPRGAEGCHCKPNNICDGALVCASSLCVDLDGVGTGGYPGSGGTGTAGESSTGGNGNGGANDGGTETGTGGTGGDGGEQSERGPCTQIGFVGEDASEAQGAVPDGFVDWLSQRGATVTRLSAMDELTDEALASLHLVVVGNVKARVDEGTGAYSTEEIEALGTWVEHGGGLITLAGYTANEQAAEPVDSLLDPFGLGYAYQERGPGVLCEGEPPVVVPVNAEHPTTSNVANVGVYCAYPVEGDGTPVLRTDDDVFAMVKQVGAGRVFAFGDEYATFANEWTEDSELDHETFWTNVLNWVTEPLGCHLGT